MCFKHGPLYFLILIVVCCVSTGAHVDSLRRVKRVIGGQHINAGQWPWLVSLQGKVPDTVWFGVPLTYRKFYCGASIINERWILTAAHCFTENNMGSRALHARYWHVRLGDVQLSPGIMDRMIGLVGDYFDINTLKQWYLHGEQIILHPEYDKLSLWFNDIALVKLEEAVPVSATEVPEIQMVNLPQQDNVSFPADGQNCTMKGWGCVENGGSVSSSAMKVVLPKVSDSECSAVWGVSAYTRLCAGHNLAARGICSGDSGGPLVCQNDNEEWIQVGIASFTSANRPGNVPGVFTRVSRYVNWIRETINNN